MDVGGIHCHHLGISKPWRHQETCPNKLPDSLNIESRPVANYTTLVIGQSLLRHRRWPVSSLNRIFFPIHIALYFFGIVSRGYGRPVDLVKCGILRQQSVRQGEA